MYLYVFNGKIIFILANIYADSVTYPSLHLENIIQVTKSNLLYYMSIAKLVAENTEVDIIRVFSCNG